MKKLLIFFLPAILLGCDSPAYRNPLDVAFGDPFILHAADGKFYMYGTSGDIRGFRVCVSDDLVTWQKGDVVYDGNASAWGTDCFWAPEVYERDGRYYLFFSANWRHNPNGDLETFRIGVAVADSPSGPFSDLYDRPVFDPGYPVIDANVLWDDDGRVYLYYSRCCYKHPVESELSAWARDKGLFDEIEESWVYGVEMKPDFSGVIGEPVALLTPPQSASDPQTGWESRSVTAGEVNRRWTEGSYAFKENGTYYMMYSANFYGGQHYAVGLCYGRFAAGSLREIVGQSGPREECGQGRRGHGNGAQYGSEASRRRDVLRLPRPDGPDGRCAHGLHRPDGGDRRRSSEGLRPDHLAPARARVDKGPVRGRTAFLQIGGASRSPGDCGLIRTEL